MYSHTMYHIFKLKQCVHTILEEQLYGAVFVVHVYAVLLEVCINHRKIVKVIVLIVGE